uniref:Uncharacterized protein n=1 Tax=Octopus bimaculoides TaxID=37653 RepID=A0A0L8G0G2_OCTBM
MTEAGWHVPVSTGCKGLLYSEVSSRRSGLVTVRFLKWSSCMTLSFVLMNVFVFSITLNKSSLNLNHVVIMGAAMLLK